MLGRKWFNSGIYTNVRGYLCFLSGFMVSTTQSPKRGDSWHLEVDREWGRKLISQEWIRPVWVNVLYFSSIDSHILVTQVLPWYQLMRSLGLTLYERQKGGKLASSFVPSETTRVSCIGHQQTSGTRILWNWCVCVGDSKRETTVRLCLSWAAQATLESPKGPVKMARDSQKESDPS